MAEETTSFTRKEIHDLRSAIGAIDMAAELVRASVPEDKKQFFDLIMKNTEVCLKALEEKRNEN